MQFKKFTPPPDLANFVCYFWTIELNIQDQSDISFRGFACRYPRLIFHHHNGAPAVSFKGNDLPLSYIGGLTSKPYTLGIHPELSMTGAILFPHTLQLLFKADSAALLDSLPDLECFTKRSLTEKILSQKTPEGRVRVLIKFLRDRVSQAKLKLNSFENAFNHLEQLPEVTRVKDLSEVFGLSERQLERKFKVYFGHSPLQFLRIKRFEKSLEYLTRKKQGALWKLSDVAYDLNYVDQSHFIRDFKKFSNHTPMQFVGLDNQTEENSAIYYS